MQVNATWVHWKGKEKETRNALNPTLDLHPPLDGGPDRAARDENDNGYCHI